MLAPGPTKVFYHFFGILPENFQRHPVPVPVAVAGMSLPISASTASVDYSSIFDPRRQYPFAFGNTYDYSPAVAQSPTDAPLGNNGNQSDDDDFYLL